MTVPEVTYHFIDLPLTRLHYCTAGKGEPLIIFPATISKIDSWKGIIQFMAQRFEVFFFELPGHGESTKFHEKFSTDLVAQTVLDFCDAKGFKKVNLMGFSFGGILTLNTFTKMDKRTDKVILLSPCANNLALKHNGRQLAFMKRLVRLLKREKAQKIFLSFLHNRLTVWLILAMVHRIGKVEKGGDLRESLLKLPASTLDVLVYQVNEILETDFREVKKTYPNPLFFAMSVIDPLLDFNTTEATLRRLFPNISTERLYLPYHNPPAPLTFGYLNKYYPDLLEMVSIPERGRTTSKPAARG